ncbi:MAG: hypothetical protein OCD02_10180 [Spirochaetaceae bacterium]
MRRIVVLILFKVCLISLFSLDNNFENRYNLLDINNITDSVMISSESGSDYFFGIEDNNLIIKQKLKNSEQFLDYYLDFNYHQFDSITEVEVIHFSRNRDMVFFIGIKEDEYSINVISIKNDNLIIRDDLVIPIDSSGPIDNLLVISDIGENAQVIFNNSNSIYSVYFDNNFINQKFSTINKFPIEGHYIKDFFISRIHPTYVEHIGIMIVENNINNEAYLVKIIKNQIKYIKITEVKEFSVNDFLQIIEGEKEAFFIDNKIININYDEFSYSVTDYIIRDVLPVEIKVINNFYSLKKSNNSVEVELYSNLDKTKIITSHLFSELDINFKLIGNFYLHNFEGTDVFFTGKEFYLFESEIIPVFYKDYTLIKRNNIYQLVHGRTSYE